MKNRIALTVFLSVFVIVQNALANENNTDEFEFDLNSIIYIEEEEKIDLGFNTAEYLPENFNPYSSYFNLQDVIFIEKETKFSKRMNRKLKRKLPKGFDAYADPKGILGINYIDENDTIDLDFDTQDYLPEGFNAFQR